MQSIPSIPAGTNFTSTQYSELQSNIDGFLDDVYRVYKTGNGSLPTILQGVFARHFGLETKNQTSNWTHKELQDLYFLKSYSSSVLNWNYNINNGVKNPKDSNGGSLQVTLLDFEESNPIALVLQVGIEKLGMAARKVLRSRYNQLPSFLDETLVEPEKRWAQRLKHIGALRRIYEEIEKELSLDALQESTLSLPTLFACIEIGELLIRKGYGPTDSWNCDDPEIKSLLVLIPKLLHFLPEEELQIGRFKLMEKIGEGGYGIVYKGYDEKLRREVAIKVPRISSDDNRESKQLAIREARASARLDHPGILPLLDIIDMPSQAILVSPFVQGASLSKWLKNKSTPISEKLLARWALEITQAMIHAHSRGVLHCDLKPENILLEIPRDDSSEEKITPKIADFGLAKLMLSATTTVSGSGVGLGTPMYMAPEQTMGRESLSVACDIYGVGGIMYQLLVNRAPFQATTLGELMREVLEKNPTPLKKYRGNVHPDLDAICMKCMEKNPALRYLTMNDLNADLERFLKGEPTIARPLGKITLALRWCKKYSLLVSLLGIIFLSLTVSTIIFMFLFQKVTIQANDNLIQKNLSEAVSKRNLRDRKLADRQFYSSEMRSIQNAFKDGEFATVIDKLNKLGPVDMGGEELRGFEWDYWNKLCSQNHQKTAILEDYAMRYSLNGNKHAAISLKKSVSISVVDINTTKEIKLIPEAQEPTYSTNGNQLAFVTSDNVIHWVDSLTFKELGSLKNEGKTIRLLFLDENRLLAMQSSNWKVIDTSSGNIICEKTGEKNLVQLNFCKAGKDRIAIWNNNGRIQVWDVGLKTMVDDFSCEGRLCQICEPSNDGHKIAWIAYPSKFIVRDIKAKTNLVSKELKDSFTFAMAWSPDDKQIALGTMEHTINIINPENGESIDRKTGHSLRNIRQITWPLGGKLSSLGCQMSPEKSELLIWDEDKVASSKVIYTLEKPALGFVLDSKKEMALLSEESNEISLISVPEGKLHKRVKLPDYTIASAAHPFSPYFVLILDNREIWKVDHEGNSTRIPIRCPSPPSGAIIISPGGNLLAIGLNAAEFDGVNTAMVNLYNIESGKLIASYLGGLSAFNTLANLPKTNSFIASQRTGAMVALNWHDATLIKEYVKAPSEITMLNLNSEGNLISVVKGLRTLQVKNFPEMTNARDFRAFEVNTLRGLDWMEDSPRLIGWGIDGTIRFWDGITGQELLKLDAHEGQVLSVTELLGGRKILSLGKDNLLKLWDATPIN